jgi:hypothetical protein
LTSIRNFKLIGYVLVFALLFGVEPFELFSIQPKCLEGRLAHNKRYSLLMQRFSHDIAIRGQKVFQRQGPGGRSSNSGI